MRLTISMAAMLLTAAANLVPSLELVNQDKPAEVKFVAFHVAP